MMFALRRTAHRVLSPQTSTFLKARSITTLRRSTLQNSFLKPVIPLQRRFASEEATQAEPEADGATEAQHGENSIAEGTDAEATSSTSEARKELESASDAAQETVESVSDAAQETVESTGEKAKGAVASTIASAAETISTTASNAAAAAAAPFNSMTGSFRDPFGSASESRQRRPTPSSQFPSTQLYIGNLYFQVTEQDLINQLRPFGEVISARIITDQRGLSKGFGYAEMATVESAAKVIEGLDQQSVRGRRITIQYALGDGKQASRVFKEAPPAKTLFIGNMSFEMSDKDLNDLFRDIENVVDVRVAIDRRTGQPKGFAHADFTDIESATKAIEKLNGKNLYGRLLRVNFSSSTSNRDKLQ